MRLEHSEVRALAHDNGESVKDFLEDFFTPYTLRGNYPVVFTTERGELLCATCAKRRFLLKHETVTAGVVTDIDAIAGDICDDCKELLWHEGIL